MPKPIRWRNIFGILDELINKRELLLHTLAAHTINLTVHERRAHKRIDFDLTDPQVYQKCVIRRWRRAAFWSLIRTRNSVNNVAAIMDHYGITVTLAADERSALMLDRNNQHALTLINTSTPNVDPYNYVMG